MFRVAIVEDKVVRAKTIHRALADAGIESDVFRSASEAGSGIDASKYAALIVERGLPNGEGLTVLRTLRTAGRIAWEAASTTFCQNHSPCTSFGTCAQAVRRAVSLSAPVTEAGDITIDSRQHAMRCAHRSVQLARAVLQIMLCVMKAGGRTVRYAMLRRAASGPGEVVTESALAVAMRRLRKKLASVGTKHQLASIRGVGFVLLASAALSCNLPQQGAKRLVICKRAIQHTAAIDESARMQ
ncbi:response regulator transcription factor [Paraburkholderia sp. 40]